ncbi:hypothetical protein KJ633_08235 [bacterium]|nr:HEAT repeat domain-containing protein [bacterium]MBU3956436.1 hypothetical protein [bacterium]
MVKIPGIALALMMFTARALYASLADDLKTDIASDKPLVRRRAVYSIIHSTLPPVAAINLLGRAVLDEDLLVKRLAVSGIGKFSRFFDDIYTDSATTTAVSTSAASGDLHPRLQGELTENTTALKKINPAATIALDILRAAASDSASVVRADAVRVLGTFPVRIVREDILAMLNDSSFIVIKEALQAAANLKMIEASDRIDKLLKHKSEIVRFSAVEFAGNMKLEEFFKQIKKIAEKDKSPEVRKKSLAAMIKIRPDDKADILKDFLNEKDIFTALDAAFLLAKDSDYSGKGVVFSAFESEDPAIRLAAAKILLYYDDEESRGLFKKLLNDSDSDVRSFAEKNKRRTE